MRERFGASAIEFLIVCIVTNDEVVVKKNVTQVIEIAILKLWRTVF
jgi:hypothetical protein